MKRILIVDDEPSIRKVLSAHLRRFGHEVETAADGAEAVVRLNDHPFQLVVSDLKMPNMDGMALLKWCSENLPGLPLILITAHGTVDSAVTALKRGAFDYITKPFDTEELHAIITKALATESANSRRTTVEPGKAFNMVGRTSAMHEVYTLITKVACSPTTVLITGESGTGKELVARAVHEQSDRKDAPFIQINCGAIPDHLFESELFGFEKGAFTGAVSAKPGKFEIADGGTLFLDEVGEMPLEMQVKMLRVLQEGRIDRVGSVRSKTVNVRIVAATNVNLQEAVEAGTFRKDLFWRLNVIPVALPPLRERRDDIPLLASHFLSRFNQRLNRSFDGFTEEANLRLQAHDWPGNIRELENLVERVVLLSDGPMIAVTDLPLGPALPTMEAPVDETLDGLGLKEYVRVHTAKLESARIRTVLEALNGNVTRAARELGISRKSLQTKMKEYGLRDPHT